LADEKNPMDPQRAREITRRVFLPSTRDNDGPFENMTEFINYYQYIDALVSHQIPTPVIRHEHVFDSHLWDMTNTFCTRCMARREKVETEGEDPVECRDFYNQCPSCGRRVSLHPLKDGEHNVCPFCGQFLEPPVNFWTIP